MEEVCWETFERNRFVGRDILIRDIGDHVRTNRNHRVVSIVGGPGTGKSWVLGRCHEDWQQRHGRHIIKLQCLEIAEYQGSRYVVQHTRIQSWLERVASEARVIDPQIPDYSLGNNPQNYIQEKFVPAICRNCAYDDDAPVLLVDDYDVLGRIAAMELDWWVLRYFLANRRFAIIIARRDQNGLHSDTLRRSEECFQVQMHDYDTGDAVDLPQVFLKIAERCYPELEVDPQEFLKCVNQIEGYSRKHPFINGFLSNRFLLNYLREGSTRCFSKSDIKDCIDQLISRPPPGINPAAIPPDTRYRPLTSVELELLQKVAQKLGFDWTEDELKGLTGCRLRDIPYLFELGVIIHSRAPNRFQIMEGLHALFACL